MAAIAERKVATKAIILSRVSSKDQEDNHSKGAQKYRMEEYCARKELEIIKIFEFTESSTIANRPKFLEAISFSKSQKEPIAIVIDKVDRLQRSYKENPLLDELMAKEKIELHFHTENCIIHKYSTSQERMVWNMYVMIAQGYVDSLKDNVNRAIGQKLRSGEWVSKAPLGYLHIPHPNRERGKSTIIIDETRAPLIRKLFEAYATGNYSLLQILRMTKEWGLTNHRGNKTYLNRSCIYEILKNSFYCGIMRVKKTGKQYPHIYPPIITKELFDTCMDIYQGRKNKPVKYAAKPFIFRGLITCAVTDHVVSAMEKVKHYKNGECGRWIYLVATDPTRPGKKVYVKEEVVLKQVEKVLKTMTMPTELKTEIIDYISSSAEVEHNFRKKRQSELQAEYTKTQNRLSLLTDLLLDQAVTKTEYDAKRQELLKKQEDIREEMLKLQNSSDNFTDSLKSLLELASEGYNTFKGSNFDKKRQLLNSVFLNLKLKGQKLDFMLHPLFDEFKKIAKSNGMDRPIIDRMSSLC